MPFKTDVRIGNNDFRRVGNRPHARPRANDGDDARYDEKYPTRNVQF
jgi:hypothetical protein